MDLSTFLRVVIRGWWLIVLATIVTAGSAAYAVSQKEPVYRATARVMLQPSLLLGDARQYLDAMNALDKRTTINTLARNATGSSMQDKVAKALNVPVSVVQDADLTAVVVPETNLIELRAQSTKPELAAAISNTVAELLQNQVPERVIELEISDRATPPASPVEPQPVRVITLGVLFGIVLGIAFSVLGYFLQLARLSSAPTAVANAASGKQAANAAEVQNQSTQQFFVN